MEEKLYNYIIDVLYPLPSCNYCQYADINIKRPPCKNCEQWEKYKLHHGHDADVKRMVKGIIKIISNEHSNLSR